MKESPRITSSKLTAAAVDRAGRVKDMAVDLAGDLAKEVKKSSRHDRLRAAVIGTWALLSLFTLCVAFSSPGSNALHAYPQVQQGGLLGTQISVENRSDRPWTDVTLTLEGGYVYRTSTIRDRTVIAVSRFVKDGVGAPETFVPRTITIECEEGTARIALGSRSP